MRFIVIGKQMLGYRRAEFDEDDDDESAASASNQTSTGKTNVDPLHVIGEPGELRTGSASHVLPPGAEFSDVVLFSESSAQSIMLRLDAEDDGEHVLAEPAKTRRAMAAAAASNAKMTAKPAFGDHAGSVGVQADHPMHNPICTPFSAHTADLSALGHHALSSSSPTNSYATRPNVVFFGLENQGHPSARIAMVKPLFGWSAKCRQIRFLWKKATGLERILILFAVLLIASAFGLFSAVNRLSYENQMLHHELVKRTK